MIRVRRRPADRNFSEPSTGLAFTMFSWLRPSEWVHFIDIRNGQISFLLRHPRKAGDTMRVRFPLSLPPPNNRRDVSVMLTACRPSRGGGYIAVAQPLLSPAKTLELTETLRKYCLVEAREQLSEVRQTDRSRISMRVLGRDLPFYRAVALDLSPGGMKLRCQGLLEVGKVMELRVESDVAGLPDMVFTARVAWMLMETAEESSTRTCVAGMAFVDLKEGQEKLLKTYLQRIAHREVTDRVTLGMGR